MQVRVEPAGPGVLTATVTGAVDMAVAGTLREQLCEAVREPGGTLVVDLAGVNFIDSTGLAALVAIKKKVDDHQGVMRLIIPAGQQVRIFELTGLDQVFPIYSTLAGALDHDDAAGIHHRPLV
jgi:anti-sigma B factor antagonist